jgi:hypothetical protein
MEGRTSAVGGGNSGELSELSRSPTSASTRSAETDVEGDLSTGKHAEASISVFDMITSELFKIGAIPLERFATDEYPEEENVAPVATSLIRISDSTSQLGDTGGNTNTKGRRKEHFQAVAKIYEACMRTFENSDAINFDYKDDSGPNGRSRPCAIIALTNDYSQLESVFSRLPGQMLGVGRTLRGPSSPTRATPRLMSPLWR